MKKEKKTSMNGGEFERQNEKMIRGIVCECVCVNDREKRAERRLNWGLSQNERDRLLIEFRIGNDFDEKRNGFVFQGDSELKHTNSTSFQIKNK